MQIERDLEAYNAWAMGKVLELCRRVDQSALVASYPVGPGSALATLQHIVWAERIWLDRWLSRAPNTNWKVPDSVDGLEAAFHEIANERRSLFESDPSLFSTDLSYTNLKGEAYRQNLGGLVLHVFNHGVHHRAQMLYFLKQYGQTVAGGLDYIFYRIAAPTILLQPAVAEGCRHWGLEVGETAVNYSAPDLDSLIRYADYGDWATQLLCNQASHLNDEQLDKDWGMGVGTIRKTLLHLYDAECFWQANWERPGSAFNHSPLTTTISEVAAKWLAMAANRKHKTLQMADQLGSAVTVDFGGGPLQFRFSESLIQLAVHGTLHRAQLNNMLRSIGGQPQAIDYVVWMRL